MKKALIWYLLWTGLYFFLSEFLVMPVYSLSAGGGIYLAVVFYLLGIFGVSYFVLQSEYSDIPVVMLLKRISFIGTLLVMIVLIVVMFIGSPLLRVNDYRTMIGEIEQSEFTSNIQPISPNEMLIVDEEIAQRVGEKVLGADPGLGSRCELGNFTLQPVNGHLYWIAPLEHSGFWKWNRFDEEGTPGYVRVSAINQEDYALVTTDKNGKPFRIKYQTGAYFSEDLSRHIYTSGYRTEMYSDYMFEVDDDWNPFWTVTLHETRIVLSGEDATGVLVVNPETGQIDRYSIKDAPHWIDRIQPESFLSSQIDDWGKYVHGFWNWSGNEKMRVVKESSVVLGNDGHSYYYFGLTSDGNDQSTVGFVMVDTRTKKAHWFKQSGATESAAKSSAEGKVQEKSYTGSEGVTYNIDGSATYEFLLKDKAGLMKLVALVNVHDHTIVGVGENRLEAIQDYREELNSRGNAVSISTSDMVTESLTSRISRFSQVVLKGGTYYYFTLEIKPNILFSAGPTISKELAVTEPGDEVTVSFVVINDVDENSISQFDNHNIGFEKNLIQVKNEIVLDSVRNQKIEVASEKVVDNQWDNLSPEEKKKLIKEK